MIIVYPAIDLSGGRCVRLTEGDFSRATVYDDDPVAVARRWEAEGARWLHVVDLDGARAGEPVQAALVAAICRAVDIPVQVGGGLRTAEAVEAAFAAGAARVVIGTAAVRDPELCRTIARAHPGAVALGLDARAGLVRVAGWTEGSEIAAATLAARARALGVAAVIYTDVARDGTGRGPDLAGSRAVAAAAGLPVVVSGGVGSVADVAAVAALAPAGIAGVIVGRALYTGAVRLADALAAAGG